MTRLDVVGDAIRPVARREVGLEHVPEVDVAAEEGGLLHVVEVVRHRQTVPRRHDSVPARIPAAAAKTLQQFVDAVERAADGRADDLKPPVPGFQTKAILPQVRIVLESEENGMFGKLGSGGLDRKARSREALRIVAQLLRRIALRGARGDRQHDRAVRGLATFRENQVAAHHGQRPKQKSQSFHSHS